jgi:hypothetical protein
MKKGLITTFMLCLLTSLSAQTDFFEFINSIDWDTTENDFVSKHSSSIQTRRHYYNKLDKTTTDYEVTGIFLGHFEYTASLYVDSISRKIISLDFSHKSVEKNNTVSKSIAFSKEMDNLLFPLFSEPDERKDDLSSSTIKRLNRKWYTTDYIVDVNHMIFSDMDLYSLSVKGIRDKGEDFRVARWGDSKESIMQKEDKADLTNDKDIYLFSDNVAGFQCNVAYLFTDDKLTMAKYLFKNSHTNKNNFIEDYKDLVELMIEKYGEPSYNSPEWRNSLYKNKPEDYGFAISLGHLSYNAGWSNEKTDITVALYGGNYEITLMIQYVSKKYEQLRDRQEIQNRGRKL